MEEIWKDIPGYERLYQASNLGQIRSLDRTVEYVKHYSGRDVKAVHNFKGRVLKQSFTSGYLGVLLSVDGNKTSELVHRLVASTFVDNPDNKPQVDHRDGDRTNNHVDNLLWVTSKENHANTISKGQHTCQQESKTKQVIDVDTGEIFNSMMSAERKYKIPVGRISSAIRSNQRVYGHKFEMYQGG